MASGALPLGPFVSPSPVSFQKTPKALRDLADLFFVGNPTAAKIMQQISAIVGDTTRVDCYLPAIFEGCDPSFLPLILDAISEANPSYKFSGYNEICRSIVFDESHQLNNDFLREKIKEGAYSEEQTAFLYELAYRRNHPNIYLEAKQPVNPKEYTLNFLWINLNPQNRKEDNAEHIFGNGLNPEENSRSEGTFADSLSKWARLNPGVKMYLWCDSALVTQKAWDRTAAVLKAISQENGVDLTLRDIREIPIVRDSMADFFHPGMPLYARVDAAKVAIVDYVMESEPLHPYCVFADRDIGPMGPDQLFDQRTQDYLKKCGYVFNRVGYRRFENSFFMFKLEERLKDVHREILVNSQSMIAPLRNAPHRTQLKSEFLISSQAVFNKYEGFKKTMKDAVHEPRKVVSCPPSQFLSAFPKEDHKSETARYIGKIPGDAPYTTWGRAGPDGVERQLLQDWKCEPLSF